MSRKNLTVSKVKSKDHIFTRRRKAITKTKSFSTTKRSFRDTFKQFSQSTSVNILKLIGNRCRGRIQRTFLLLTFLVSTFIAAFYIHVAYSKWLATPMLIGMSPTATSIANIPFPAITVCNLNKAKRRLVEHLTPNMQNYANLQFLCRKREEKGRGNLNETESWQERRKFLVEVSQPCTEMLISCRFGSVLQNCYDMFEPILTDEGLCCTFNQISSEYIFTELSRSVVLEPDYVDLIQPLRWTPEQGYERDIPEKFYPRKTLGGGVNMGLTLVLNSSNKDYFCSSTRSHGFKVLMHSPAEMPKIMNYAYLIPNGFETQIAIEPVRQIASAKIRQLPRKSRRCVFESEINLKFYKTYTKTHCKLECELQQLEKECRCVPYYLPRYSQNTPVCGLQHNDCVNWVRFKAESTLEEDTICNHCKTACFSLEYYPIMSRIRLSAREFSTKENITAVDLGVKELAVVHFYFSSAALRASTKEEFLGFTGFLGKTGGIIGMLLGFSFLTFVELVYFLFMMALTLCRHYFHGNF